jgi:predicted nucleic acid-binding protein
MAVYYFDTSAIVKRYVLEIGTPWVLHLVDPANANEFYMVQLTGPELIAALFRRVRIGNLALADARRAANNFRTDWQNQYQLVEVHANVIERAMALAESHGLRGYDAVHLAAALEIQAERTAHHLTSIVFVSADSDQLQVAVVQGLQVENPNSYP